MASPGTDERVARRREGGRAGANAVYESAGMTVGLLGCSLEAHIIDNEMLGAARRIRERFPIGLAVDAMAPGPEQPR